MNRMEGLPPEAAFHASGYATNSENWSALENNKNIREYMRMLAEQNGITPQTLMKKLAEGLDATAFKDFCTKDGKLVEGPERTDYQTRLMYIQLVGKWLGLEVQKDDGKGDGTTNILIISDKYKDMSPEALKENMQKIRTGLMHKGNVLEEIVF